MPLSNDPCPPGARDPPEMTTGSHVITNGKYSIEDVVALVAERPQLELDEAIRAAIIRGAAFVRSKAEEGSHIYGVNAGFGAMCRPVFRRRTCTNCSVTLSSPTLLASVRWLTRTRAGLPYCSSC